MNLFGNLIKPPATKREAMARYERALAYHNTFNSRDGRLVLADILEEGFVFRPIVDESQMAYHNVAVGILERMGIAHAGATDILVNAVLNIPIIDPTKENTHDSQS